MAYTKIGFKDRIDNKPTTYIVDGKPVEILKDNTSLKQKGTSLNADNLNHLEDGIYQNSMEIEKFNTELLTNKIKSVKENSNVVSLKDNVEGIANIAVAGNTININKEPIISDFKNKTRGNTSSNPNIAKSIRDTVLKSPESFNYEFESGYLKNVYEFNNKTINTTTNDKNLIPQQLFSFNIIDIVEKRTGKIQGSNTKEKVEWLKKNVKSITCNWWGYGECPSGNIAYLKPFKADESKWLEWGKTTSTNIAKVTVTLLNVHYYIDENGFVSFLALTDASDGKTPSVIYTDYVNIEIQLKTELQSVGEKEKQIEVKSVGKNLFNINAKPDYTQTSTYEVNDDKITITSTKGSDSAIVKYLVKLKTNTKYTFSVKSSRTGSSGGGFYINDDIGNILVGTADLSQTYSFTTKNTGNVYIWLYGERESKTGSSATYWDIQLKEGLKSEYEPYKEDKVNIQLKEPLRGLPNGVRDTINTDGTITRRVGKVVLDGSENISEHKNNEKTFSFRIPLSDKINIKNKNIQAVCDKFIYKDFNAFFIEDTENFSIHPENDSVIYICIEKSKLSASSIDGFKKWLKENPTTVYYELAKPTTENISQPLNLKIFEGGHIIVNTEIAPVLGIKYPSNINSRISSLESAEKNLKDSLGGAWKTLLILADKELQMKSIKLLETENVTDIKGKINEIIGVWKDEHI